MAWFWRKAGSMVGSWLIPLTHRSSPDINDALLPRDELDARLAQAKAAGIHTVRLVLGEGIINVVPWASHRCRKQRARQRMPCRLPLPMRRRKVSKGGAQDLPMEARLEAHAILDRLTMDGSTFPVRMHTPDHADSGHAAAALFVHRPVPGPRAWPAWAGCRDRRCGA